MSPAETLESALRRLTREGQLYDRQDSLAHCYACGHECRIAEGRSGICRMRYNQGGRLMVPFGYVAGLRADPIEKKPFFHVLPGSSAMSFGMLGCNFSCSFCQNWLSSQVLREPSASAAIERCEPKEIVALARQNSCPVIVSTYNEPLITSEWAAEIFALAQARGLRCGYVSNGHANRRVLEYLRPFMSLYKVDLKCFDAAKYRDMTGGAMKNVLRSIEDIKALGFWMEVVTLIIPGWNDSNLELRALAKFLAGVSPDIPWHVTAYHPEYHMTEPGPTPPQTLLRAARIGQDAGLRFVYAGNLPQASADLENTRCPACAEILVERRGFSVIANRLNDGKCPKCAAVIPGVWA
jgi:pyruvate formate lyase activating enzyme